MSKNINKRDDAYDSIAFGMGAMDKNGDIISYPIKGLPDYIGVATGIPTESKIASTSSRGKTISEASDSELMKELDRRGLSSPIISVSPVKERNSEQKYVAHIDRPYTFGDVHIGHQIEDAIKESLDWEADVKDNNPKVIPGDIEDKISDNVKKSMFKNINEAFEGLRDSLNSSMKSLQDIPITTSSFNDAYFKVIKEDMKAFHGVEIDSPSRNRRNPKNNNAEIKTENQITEKELDKRDEFEKWCKGESEKPKDPEAQKKEFVKSVAKRVLDIAAKKH